MNLTHIPFNTVAERHLVYVYLIVWALQFGYGSYIAVRWLREKQP